MLVGSLKPVNSSPEILFMIFKKRYEEKIVVTGTESYVGWDTVFVSL